MTYISARGSFAPTYSPTRFLSTIPTAGSILSDFFARPAPSIAEAMPMSSAFMERTWPAARLLSSYMRLTRVSFSGSSIKLPSPPSASTISRSLFNAAPEAIARSAAFLASPIFFAAPPSMSIYALMSTHTSRSGSPLFTSPRSTYTASATSNPLPTARPSGQFMSVISATVRLPSFSPIFTIVDASSRALSSVSMKAPLLVFTSSTIASAPAAIFLLMMLEAISGMLFTVPVTSRRAYINLSAGSSPLDCPMTQRPVFLTISIISPTERSIFTPGIASSLSSVPPVCPSPRPDIFATVTPHAAAIGAETSVVVSPTPPVECLSTFVPLKAERSTIVPEHAIAFVSAAIS